MGIIKTFEEFSSELNKKSVKEGAIDAGEDSKVVIDDVTLDSGEEIKSTEILGTILSSKTEKEFKEYFYDTYGNGAFTDEDISTLLKFYLEYTEEKNTDEVEAEEEEEAEEEAPEGEGTADDLEDELAKIK
jgi:hypothetical protein